MAHLREATEFHGRRSTDYRVALTTFADAWHSAIAYVNHILQPDPIETILEIGAGNDYFSRAIVGSLGSEGLLVASDPSVEQLSELECEAEHGNIKVVATSADTLDIGLGGIDAVWSRGAVHHVSDKTASSPG